MSRSMSCYLYPLTLFTFPAVCADPPNGQFAIGVSARAMESAAVFVAAAAGLDESARAPEMIVLAAVFDTFCVTLLE